MQFNTTEQEIQCVPDSSHLSFWESSLWLDATTTTAPERPTQTPPSHRHRLTHYVILLDAICNFLNVMAGPGVLMGLVYVYLKGYLSGT